MTDNISVNTSTFTPSGTRQSYNYPIIVGKKKYVIEATQIKRETSKIMALEAINLKF